MACPDTDCGLSFSHWGQDPRAISLRTPLVVGAMEIHYWKITEQIVGLDKRQDRAKRRRGTTGTFRPVLHFSSRVDWSVIFRFMPFPLVHYAKLC